VVEHPQDFELAQLLLAGNERAFVRFFNDYYPRLFRFALIRLSSDANAADETAQRAISRGVRKLHLYRAQASLFTWLCQICRHEIHSYVEVHDRHARRVVSIDDDPEIRAALESIPADAGSDPTSAARHAELQQSVQTVLDYLPARYAETLEWKYVEDISVNEIAERLNVTTHAAESLLARARRAFRDAWSSVTAQPLPELSTMESAP
jgi:RNA polymerase sigma-70 factor (ECF subfamily)